MSLTDLLNEICKVSAIKATSALSKFLNTPVAIDVKPVEIKPLQEVNLFIDPNTHAVSLFFEIDGNLKGASFMLWSEKAAHAMCDVLYHKPRSEVPGFREEEISALSEVSNIVIGNFLTAFAQSLHLDTLLHKAPHFNHDLFNKIKMNILPKIEKHMKEFVVDISFSFEHIYVKGYVIVLFERENVNKALHNISVDSNI